MTTLNSKKIKKRSKAKGDDGEGLYVRGRTDHRDSRQSRGKLRSKSRGGRLKCYIFQSKDHLKRNCLKNNRKKSTGYIKGSVQLINNRECKMRGISKLETLEKEGFSIKLHSGKVKVINGFRVVLSRIQRDNCIYSLDGHAMAGELNASVEEKDSLAQVWHKRLGHISEAGLHVLKKQGLFGKKYRTVKKLRTDNGLEFRNQEFEQLCIESRIARHITVVGTPQKNGLAECMNRTPMDKVRCLLINSGLPKTFWVEATCTSAYLINRSPSIAIEKKTPMEMGLGDSSDYEMLRIFGCVSYPYNKQGKLEPRAIKYVLLGYPEGVKEEEDTHEPLIYHDAVACEDTSKWKAAIKEGMYYLRNNKTWELVDHPTGKMLVSCKWLFKIKEWIESVQKPRYKAMLVACGLTQRACIDYNEVFYLVVRHTSIRVILALTACKDYELEQLDVKTAFLHGNLEEVIYMRQPPGYEQDNKVCLLQKSLYGLKQSPRQWYRRFDEYMLSNGFKRSSYDRSVYYRSYTPSEYIYLLLYVDDMLIACKSNAEIGSTMYLLKKKFDMKELEEEKKILDNGKSVKMPLDGHFNLSVKDCPVKDCDVKKMNLVYGIYRSNHVNVTDFVDSDYAKDLDKGREVLEAKTVKVLKVGTEHSATDALTMVLFKRSFNNCIIYALRPGIAAAKAAEIDVVAVPSLPKQSHL
nr:retrovirus-related Pol polyprotein from transposon TNT 1-94 [Tanacetum cinerariifolium]